MSLTKAERDAIDPQDFAGPSESFPCDTRAHLSAACRLYGHAADPAAVKAAIIRIAKRKGWENELPEDWTDTAEPDADADDGGDMNSRIRRRTRQVRGK